MKYVLIAAVASLAACNSSRFDAAERDVQQFRESIDGTGATEVKAVVEMGAGELRVSTGGAKLLEADIRTSGEKPRIRFDSGTRGRLTIEQESKFRLGRNMENDWDLHLGGPAEMDLELHLGAGEADVDLSDIRLRSLVIHMGAGELKLNLRGAYQRDVSVEIHGGVGEARIRLPKDMRIDAEVHGGLGDVDAHGLDHQGDRYVSRGEGSGPRMDLEVNGGIGHIELDAQ